MIYVLQIFAKFKRDGELWGNYFAKTCISCKFLQKSKKPKFKKALGYIRLL